MSTLAAYGGGQRVRAVKQSHSGLL